jgi:hypothetical protein
MRYDRARETGDRGIRGGDRVLASLSWIIAIPERQDLELAGEKGLPTTSSVSPILRTLREYSFTNDCLKKGFCQVYTFRLQDMGQYDGYRFCFWVPLKTVFHRIFPELHSHCSRILIRHLVGYGCHLDIECTYCEVRISSGFRDERDLKV